MDLLAALTLREDRAGGRQPAVRPVRSCNILADP
jgi:hypothetical protein